MNRNYLKTRNRHNLRIFSGSSHSTLSKSVAAKCGVTLGELHLGKFANNETSVDLRENVRGQNIYLIQTGGGPKPNDDFMELLFLINSFKLSSADAINVIIPYFFYSKGDQKDSHKRVPITAKLITNLLKKAGADHVMIIEPHTPQLEGFFGTPVDALKVEPQFCDWIRKNIANWHEYVVVSPDEGSVKRCTSVANDLILDFALINNRKDKYKKHRGATKKSRHPSSWRDQKSAERDLEIDSDTTKDSIEDERGASASTKLAISLTKRRKKISVSGSVSGKNVIVVDDMIDTGHTLKEAIETLRKFGALGVYIMATHGLFSGNSIEMIKENSDFIRKVIVSNTVPQDNSKEKLGELLHVIDVSGLIAEYIRRHHYRESVQVLCHYLPLFEESRDSNDEENELEIEEESSDESDLVYDMAAINLPNAAENEVSENSPRDLRLMHLRKGFRLSSMCWDD